MDPRRLTGAAFRARFAPFTGAEGVSALDARQYNAGSGRGRLDCLGILRAEQIAGDRREVPSGRVFHRRLSGGLRTARGYQPHAPLTVDAALRRLGSEGLQNIFGFVKRLAEQLHAHVGRQFAISGELIALALRPAIQHLVYRPVSVFDAVITLVAKGGQQRPYSSQEVSPS